MPTPSPIEEVVAQEQALRRAIYGRGSSGALSTLRRPDREGLAAYIRTARARDSRVLTRSRWWGDLWLRTQDKITDALIEIARTSGSRVARQVGARLSEAPALARALEAARAEATEIAARLSQSVATSADAVVADLAQRQLAIRQIAEGLADRLGPTERQLNRIATWESRQAAAGVAKDKILAGVRSRSRAAAAQRARAIASDAVVAEIAQARVAMYQEAGVLIYSASVADDRRRELHRAQTEATLAEPVLAGEPWRGAPFAGLPPYEIGCRCWPEAVTSVEAPKEASAERAVVGSSESLAAIKQRLENGEDVASLGLRGQAKNSAINDIASRMERNNPRLFPSGARAQAQEFIDGWASTSGDSKPRAIALQLAAQEEFGLVATVSHFKPADLDAARAILANEAPAMRAFLRAQYEATQDYLKPFGASHITLVRGANYDRVELGVDRINLQPLSSWTADMEAAADFGDYIHVINIPVEDVMSTARSGSGCLSEYEVIVLGRDIVGFTTRSTAPVGFLNKYVGGEW